LDIHPIPFHSIPHTKRWLGGRSDKSENLIWHY
jgi:hypothetical protein